MLRGCLTTAASANDCHLHFSDTCGKKIAEITGSDLEDINDEQVATAAVNDNIKKVSF